MLDVVPDADTTRLELRASTGDTIYFEHNSGLYRSDGTRAGTS